MVLTFGMMKNMINPYLKNMVQLLKKNYKQMVAAKYFQGRTIFSTAKTSVSSGGQKTRWLHIARLHLTEPASPCPAFMQQKIGGFNAS